MGNASTAIRAAPQSPERHSGYIALESVESPAVRAGIDYWRRLCGERRFPPRSAMSPNEIRGVLRNTVLLRVVDGGADYEYRVVGDAHVIAYGFSMHGKILSEIERFAPGHGPVLKALYDRVLRKREPFALRGWLERGDTNKQYIYSESAFMPLGPDDDTIDHVLNFSAYIPHDTQ